MSGFPTRISTAELGPEVVNVAAVTDPAKQLNADYWNLIRYQVAGMGLLCNLAKVAITGATGAITARSEAWNPDGLTTGLYLPPTVVHVGTGHYTIVYAATYPDEAGNLITLAYSLVKVTPTAPAGIWGETHALTDAHSAEIYLYKWNAGTSAFDLTDLNFIAEFS